MTDGGLTVIDGNHLQITDLRLPYPDGTVKVSQLIELCESEASSQLFGLSLPNAVKSSVMKRLNGYSGDDGGYLLKELSEGEFRKLVVDYFSALKDVLQDDPLVVSILDGCALRIFLDDEDDFAMLAENLFTDLDVDDNGKLSKNEIENALIRMGVGMGVPPFSDCRDLLENIIKKHGAEGEEQLGQAQFAHLFQKVLQDLADALTKRPVTVIQNIKVINGSKLNKILADDRLFDSVIEKLFENWDIRRAVTERKNQFRLIVESKGTELGLPLSESNEAMVHLYDQIFTDISDEMFSQDIDRGTFQETAKVIFRMFADQLRADPVFIDSES